MSSLDETDSTLARQDSYLLSSILERFENAPVTVNYSHYPHFQDYSVPENKHATNNIAAELCIHAFHLAMWYVACQNWSIPGAK